MESYTEYPVTLDIEYPDRELNRWTSVLRPFMLIPIAVVLSLVSGPGMHAGRDIAFEAGGIVFGATVLMLVVRQKYPRWWFDWNVALTKFGLRVASYAALLRDEYPSTDEEQAVHVSIRYPDVTRDLNPWMPLVKCFLAIPHYIVMAFLCVAAIGGVIVAWFIIPFTGRYPRPIFEFVVAVMRWWLRVAAYAFLLVTDRYPPFDLEL